VSAPRRPAAGRALGEDVARLLAGAWRPIPEPPAIAADELPLALARAEERLLSTGCGALVWRRLRHTDQRALRAAAPYRAAYRHQALHSAVEGRRIAVVVRAVRDAGIEPLLVKGWASSRRYPEPGLRPSGDVDLCVAPGERAAVERALAAGSREGAGVDLHTTLDDLPDRPLRDVLARAELVPLGDPAATRVLVPCVEDHLRLLALHLLRHGAWRPLWMCDVALVLESAGPTFDWDRCLRGPGERARRVACVIGLAHRLLGARIPRELPSRAACQAQSVPRWLASATLAQWGTPYRRYSGLPMAASLTAPVTFARALGARWPNPIEATMSVGAPVNGVPRLPFQLADAAARAARALAEACGRGAAGRVEPAAAARPSSAEQ
jgi:hypothetical protein